MQKNASTSIFRTIPTSDCLVGRAKELLAGMNCLACPGDHSRVFISENNSTLPASSIILTPSTLLLVVHINAAMTGTYGAAIDRHIENYCRGARQSTIYNQQSTIHVLVPPSFLRNDYRLWSSNSGALGTSGTSNTSDTSEPSFPQRSICSSPRSAKQFAKVPRRVPASPRRPIRTSFVPQVRMTRTLKTSAMDEFFCLLIGYKHSD